MHMHDFLNCFRILLNDFNFPVSPVPWCHTLTTAVFSLEYSIVGGMSAAHLILLWNMVRCGSRHFGMMHIHIGRLVKEVQSDLSLHYPPQTYFHILYVEE